MGRISRAVAGSCSIPRSRRHYDHRLKLATCRAPVLVGCDDRPPNDRMTVLRNASSRSPSLYGVQSFDPDDLQPFYPADFLGFHAVHEILYPSLTFLHGTWLGLIAACLERRKSRTQRVSQLGESTVRRATQTGISENPLTSAVWPANRHCPC